MNYVIWLCSFSNSNPSTVRCYFMNIKDKDIMCISIILFNTFPYLTRIECLVLKIKPVQHTKPQKL